MEVREQWLGDGWGKEKVQENHMWAVAASKAFAVATRATKKIITMWEEPGPRVKTAVVS